MITIKFMKPFYTKVSGSKLRLVFTFKYLSIIKDDEVYHFIPIEGKEMIVDLNTMKVENLSEVFVFQRGNRFIRLPLYQLMLVWNVHEHLEPILEDTGVDEKFDGVLEEEPMKYKVGNKVIPLKKTVGSGKCRHKDEFDNGRVEYLYITNKKGRTYTLSSHEEAVEIGSGNYYNEGDFILYLNIKEESTYI